MTAQRLPSVLPVSSGTSVLAEALGHHYPAALRVFLPRDRMSFFFLRFFFLSLFLATQENHSKLCSVNLETPPLPLPLSRRPPSKCGSSDVSLQHEGVKHVPWGSKM